MSKFDIITVGDTSIDTFLVVDEDDATVICNLKKDFCEICFNFADKIPVKSITECVGGNAANSAVGLSRLGLKTAIHSIIGQDEPATEIMQTFHKEKIDDRFIRQSGKTNRASIISFEGERTIFSYHEKRDYHLPQLTPTSWLYITSMRDGFPAVFHRLVEYINHHQPSVVYNPGTFQLRAGLPASQAILHQTAVLILNKEEAALWLSRPATAPLEELLNDLAMLGPKAVVITDGERGSYGFDGINYYHCPSVKIKLVESTGAGDAYASALTAALFYGLSLKEAMHWGTINSTSVISEIGAQAGLLKLTQIKELSNQSKYPLAVPLLS